MWNIVEKKKRPSGKVSKKLAEWKTSNLVVQRKPAENSLKSEELKPF